MYLQGKELMVLLDANDGSGAKTIAYATSHELHLSSSTESVATKDDNENYEQKEVSTKSVELTTENLIAADVNDEGSPNYTTLVNLMRKGTTVKVFFSHLEWTLDNERYGSDNYIAKRPSDGDTVHLLATNAIITSLELNAENKQNVSYKATFKGTGITVIEPEDNTSIPMPPI